MTPDPQRNTQDNAYQDQEPKVHLDNGRRDHRGWARTGIVYSTPKLIRPPQPERSVARWLPSNKVGKT